MKDFSQQNEDDWEVDLPSLHGGVVGVAHTFFGAPDGVRAVVVYDDVQLPPGCSRFAVLEADTSTQVGLNPKKVICTNDMHTVCWLNEVLLAIRVCILEASNSLVRSPVLLIDLSQQAFSSVDPGTNEETWASLLHGQLRIHSWEQDLSQAIRSISVDSLAWRPLSDLDSSSLVSKY
ncbi:MAG: hypothetical protein AAF394_06880 [Planctomycetota bacterium]